MGVGGLGDLLRLHAELHSVPGAAVGILRNGRVTTAYHGVADLTTETAVSAETRFGIGSITKSMVATVIARLAAAGRLSLADRVADRVPELQASEWAREATLRDLLANRSGLPLRAALEFGFDDRADQAADALSRLATDVAGAGGSSPGWSYSNVGWCLLGRAIEVVTGASWEEAMAHDLGAAGLRETTFTPGAEPLSRATGHEVTAGGVTPVAALASRAYGPAGTNTVSTVTDLLRFAALHLEDPGLAPLRTVHAEVFINGWLDSWCLGWGLFDWVGGPVWGWDGVVNGERSVVRILPAQDAAVVLMTNASTGRAMYRSLIPELMRPLGIDVPPLRLDASPGAAGDLSRFAGVYGWPDERVEVTAAGTHVVVRDGEAVTEARPLDDRSFLVDPRDPDNPTVTFGGFDAAGRPSVVYHMLWGLPRLHD